MTRRRIWIGVVGLGLLLAGCIGEKAVAPALSSAADTLGQVVVSPMNAIIAVGDTLSVTVAGQTVAGTPVTTFDSVLYMLNDITDTLRVRVSPTGVVTALASSEEGRPVLLNVLAFKDRIAAAEQAIIQVTETRITGATLSIQPIPPDSVRLARGTFKTIVPVIQNPTTGESVPSPTIRYVFSAADSSIMGCYVPSFPATATVTTAQLMLSNCALNGNQGRVQLNQIIPEQVGTPWIRANVTVYGVPLSDSVQYTVTQPFAAEIDVGPANLTAFSVARSNVFIAPGGTVIFYNNFDPQLAASVVFTLDNPAAATAADPPATDGGSSGNVTTLMSYQYSIRRFVSPGVYQWTVTVSGSIPPYTGATATGLITVQ